MSLYMVTDKPASRIRPVTGSDMLSSPDSLNKRIPRNAKYANVKSTIQNGTNVNNYKPKVDRSGELFRRITRRQLHALMVTCEQGDESVYDLAHQIESQEMLDDDGDDIRSQQSGYSAFSVQTAASSSPTIVTHESKREAKGTADREKSDCFLLLDSRDEDEYAKCHLQGAVHYPLAYLRRDHFLPSFYHYKNVPSKIIVVYDTDPTSRIALEMANLFVQKGYQNVFYLTGGLKYFAEKYISRIVGVDPNPRKKSSSSTSSSSSSSLSSSSRVASSTPHALSNVRLPTGTNRGVAIDNRPGGSVSRAGISSQASHRSGTSQSSSTRPLNHNATSLTKTNSGRESPRAVMERAQRSQLQAQRK